MNIKVNSFYRYKNLSVLQFSTEEKNSFEYISGPSAIKSGLVKVSEISMAGSVNDLIVENLLDKFLFFSDGDILIGAKQNRVINSSMLLEPNSKTTIPVSCVEAGRWHHVSRHFTSSDNIAPVFLRFLTRESIYENLEKGGSFYADQAKVWNSIDHYFKRIKFSESPTRDLNSSFDANRETMEEYLNHFTADKESNGTALFFGDKILSIDIFNRDEIFKEYFPKLIRSCAAETYYLMDKEIDFSEELAMKQTNDMLSKLQNQNYISKKTPGVGEFKSFCDDKISGFILSYENHLIHLSILNIIK